MGVDLVIGDGSNITLQPFNFNERNRASSQNLQGYATKQYTTYRYRVRNRQIVLTPAATGDVTLEIWYIPDILQLTDLTDEVPVNDQLGGWLEYVIVDVCIKCKQKEEAEFGGFFRQKEDILKRINTEVQIGRAHV